MAIAAMCANAALGILLVVVAAHALTMDQDATNDLKAAAESAGQNGEIAIVFPAPRGSTRREELLHAKGIDDASISLYYNRKSNKISLETLYGGHLKSLSWSLNSHPQGNLILTVTSERVKLSVGCRQLHWHSMFGELDLIQLLAHQNMKLYRGEGAAVEIYGSEQAALESLGCESGDDKMRPASLVPDGESDVEEVKEFLEKDAIRKRGEQMQGDDYRANSIDGVLPPPTIPPRGDIPSNAIETCDDEVIRQLQFLRQTIEALRREIGEQKGVIDSLRGQLRLCCQKQPPPPPPQPVVERCTGSSCYPGY